MKAKRNTRRKTNTKRRNAPRARNTAAPRRRNTSRRRPPRRHRRRRNTSLKPIGMMQTGMFALIGLVLTRQLPQMVLGTRNSGIIGYFANFVAAMGSSFAANKMTSQKTGQAVMIGGMLYLVNRIISEQFAPVGKVLSLAGLGDPSAANLGRIRSGYFPFPVVIGKDGRPVIPQAILNATREEVARSIPAATSSNVRGLSRGLRRAA